jgi:hypothetical protein
LNLLESIWYLPFSFKLFGERVHILIRHFTIPGLVERL